MNIMYQLTMTFTDDETASILSDFPKFELSYETMFRLVYVIQRR